MSDETPKAKATEPKKAKRYRTASGRPEHVPGLGFVITDEILQKPFTIRAIENFGGRTGKSVMGKVVVLD